MMVVWHKWTHPCHAWPLACLLPFVHEAQGFTLCCNVSESRAKALELTEEEELVLSLDTTVSQHIVCYNHMLIESCSNKTPAL